MTGYKERFQQKKVFPRLPSIKKEEFETNPWGKFMSPALQRIVDERRQEDRLQKESARKSSHQNAQTG